MAWEMKEVQGYLDRYYPGGKARPALISEAEWDVALNDWEGCQDIEGIAVDLNRDNQTDIFLYNYGVFEKMAVTSPHLQNFLRPLQSFFKPKLKRPRCENKAEFLEPAAFPFRGQLLPDTKGKITSIMFTASPLTAEAMAGLLEARPDLKAHALTFPGGYLPDTLSKREVFYYMERRHFLPERLLEHAGRLTFSEARLRGGDWEPYHPQLFVQDDFHVGINEYGEVFGSAPYDEGIHTYVAPLLGWSLDAYYQTDFYQHGGNILSSSNHLFIPDRYDFEWGEEFNDVQIFASGKKLVPIDYQDVYSAARLDMILTPTEEIKDGKPVVFLAEWKNRWHGNFPQLTKESLALDRIANKLERDFYVERIPYVFTGEVGGWWRERSETLSYNNVLLERYVENGRLVRRVYLPHYRGYEKYNEEAAQAYRRYGYEIIPILGLDEVAKGSGSSRSLVKVTGRSALE